MGKHAKGVVCSVIVEHNVTYCMNYYSIMILNIKQNSTVYAQVTTGE